MDSFTLDKIEFDAVRRILSGFCRCSLGRALALRIGPSRNPQVINLWLEQVTQMVRAVRDFSPPPFGGVTDITAQMERATPGGGAGGEDFATIASTLEGAAAVKSYLVALPEELSALHALETDIADFSGEISAIRSIIENDGTVSDRASERLAKVRREIEESSQKIHDVIYGYLHQPEVAKLLQNVQVTMHGDRFVLPVRLENKGRLPGVVHRASNTGATLFVEPNACVELNNRLMDLYEDERREIQRLLSLLALRISAVAPQIAAAMRDLAQIDLLSAKAQYACEFDMTCPRITERGPLELSQARHPLLIDQAARQAADGLSDDRRHKVVPIDVRLGKDFDVLVVTGSNTGGKTVTLKTVALLVVMAQSGMHIPAQRGAVFPAFRDIFIDIGDEQSLQQSLSTFGAHIKRIRYILQKADPSCLVLLDELGSGTDPDEGGAIGQAILDEIRRAGCLAMATTHLSVLKAYAFNHDRVDNASVEFDTKTLSPTYHLRIGTPGESHAITVAAHLGLPKRIVGAARQYLGSQGKQFRRAIQATTLVRQDAEHARTTAVQATLAAQGQQEVYEAKLADLHRLQEEFNTWLARLPELKAGDEVFVPSVNKLGHLVRLELHRQIALVDVDTMQVEVPLRDLMPDLGQDAVREQIAALRQQILDQAKAVEEGMEKARRIKEEYQHSMAQQKERARQFDRWLSMIGRVKVGDEVPIAIRPGKGILIALDFTGLKARVNITLDGHDSQHGHDSREGKASQDGKNSPVGKSSQIEISLQDIFPQTGPFAPRYNPSERTHQRGRNRFEHQDQQTDQHADQRHGQHQGQRTQTRHGHAAPGHTASASSQAAPGQGDRSAARTNQPADQSHGQQAQRGCHDEPEELDNRPMIRRSADDQAAQQNRRRLLAVQPGQQVYVVPFHKRATLIRINEDREQAVVQSGVFEMELPLADLEPVKEEAPSPRRQKGQGQRPPKGQQHAGEGQTRQDQAQPGPAVSPNPRPPA